MRANLMPLEQVIDATAPIILDELCKLALSGAVSAAAALDHVFKQFFPDRTPAERLRFLMRMAPTMRRLAIALTDPNQRIGESDITAADLRLGLSWLDEYDKRSADIVDLHYFGGLSFEEIATALDVRVESVLRDLKFAEDWLRGVSRGAPSGSH